MSAEGRIKQLIDDGIRSALDALGSLGDGGTDSGDVTQLKRENTGLRNRVKALEEKADLLSERVDALESPPPSAVASAGTASAQGSAKNTK